MVLSLLCCKLPVVIHALALHLEQHGVADQAAVGFSLLDSCLELNDSVLSFLAVPETRRLAIAVLLLRILTCCRVCQVQFRFSCSSDPHACCATAKVPFTAGTY